MTIELKTDYNGKPYIELKSDEEDALDGLLEYFIRQARERGVEIINETDMDTRDDYASIRIKGSGDE